MAFDQEAFLAKAKKLMDELPDQEDGESDDDYLKRLGAVDVTDKNKNLGITIGKK